MNCHLCDSVSSRKLCRDDFRSYYHCEKCGLIFVPASDHISVEEEKKRYKLHENSIDHEGYVRFLNEIAVVAGKWSSPTGLLLDYGSGPEIILTRLLRKKGYDCTPYDPLYDIGNDVFSRTYDTIVLCEVIEHLRDIRIETEKIKNVLNPAASIIIRTRLHPVPDEFDGWWYKNDRTHVNFFAGKL